MNITAIHALVGGLAAQLGGGSFTTGATGAASAEISRNLVKDLSPDAQQWASVIIGGAAAKVVGGNAQVGASTALSGTVNNDLAHKITGITKGILNGVEEDAKGLIDFIVNYQETIENLKDTANAIYDLGKEQGFGAIFAEIGNAIGVDWVNKYDTIENEYINGMIDENTYDYRIGMLAGEVTYFIASTVAEPEKLAVNPKLLTKVAKLSKVEKSSEFTLETVIITAERIEGSSKGELRIGRFTAQETSKLAATNAERAAAQEAALSAKNTGWIDSAGNINWSKNDGFVGTPKNVTLQPGAKIDRYGYESGSYVSPQGTSYEMRALVPGTEAKPYNVYEVVKPIDALGGEIAPWFNQPGGGIQLKLGKTIQELLDGGYIRKVEP